MSQGQDGRRGAAAQQASNPREQGEGGPDVDGLLAEVQRHLDDGHPRKAVEAINHSKLRSARVANALGVCKMREGDAQGAVEHFRRLVVKHGIQLRDDVDPVLKLNFAVALLASGNAEGFREVLSEFSKHPHPAVAKYRDAYQAWRRGRSMGQKLRGFFGLQSSAPPDLGFPLGEL